MTRCENSLLCVGNAYNVAGMAMLCYREGGGVYGAIQVLRNAFFLEI